MPFFVHVTYIYSKDNFIKTLKDMKKIKIKGKNYNIKYTIRALFIFEQITGKPFKIETLLDNYVFFYSIILANNMDKENIISWDEFIDELDKNPNLFSVINDAIDDKQEKDKIFQTEEVKDDKGEKKN